MKIASFDGDKWRSVVGFEGIYEVSSDGLVRRIKAAAWVRAGRLLRGEIDKDGYVRVQLSDRETGRRPHRFVHQLVCESFYGPRPSPEHEAAHFDGNKQHNSVDNLRWALPIDNSADRIRHGTQVSGERHHSRKLTESLVVEIRSRWATGRCTQVGLAAEYGVSNVAIRKIVNRMSWKHVQ